jgi:DNA-binding MarR family transcriptional regulator
MKSERPVPLARLLAMALNALIDPLHERLAALGFDDIRSAFAFVLLASRERPLTGNEIALFMGMSKQAASKLVDAMEHGDYLVRRAHPEDARVKLLHVAPRGKKLLEHAERIYLELEADWAAVLGKRRVSALRDDLSEVLRALHGGKLPPIKPTW